MSFHRWRRKPHSGRKKASRLVTSIAGATPLLLTMLLIFSSCFILMPEAKASASATIIYSDPSDGFVRSDGLVDPVNPFIEVGDSMYPANAYNRGFVKFSLSGVSGTLSSARLYLYISSSTLDGFDYFGPGPLLNPLLGDCRVIHIADYGTLSFGAFNALSIGNDPVVLIGSTAYPPVGYVSIDVTAAMQDDIDQGRAWTAFMIKLDMNTDGDGFIDEWTFRSSEQSGTDQDPYVEYTVATGLPHWTQVDGDGFGDANNKWFGSWHEFKGQIYIGVSNDVTGIEVWRSTDGAVWSQVGGNGFGDANNVYINDFEEFQLKLYASVTTTGPTGLLRIFRSSSDGVSWTQIGPSGFGDANNWRAYLYSFGSYLTAFTGNYVTGTEIWTWDGSSWTQRMSDGIDGDANNDLSSPLGQFNGYLYITTFNFVSGAELWRSNDGVYWAKVNNDGFNGDPNNFFVSSMEEFSGYLYAVTYNDVTGFELWRSIDGTSWGKVGSDGFGDRNNYDGRFIIFKYELYLIASNWDRTTNTPATGVEVWRTSNGVTWTQVNVDGFGDQNNRLGYPIVGGEYLYVAISNGATGVEVWRSSDGTSWSQVNDDGFGDSNNRVGLSRFIFKNYLYVASDNGVTGVEVWRLDEPTGPLLVGLLNFDDYHNRMGSLTPMEPSTAFHFPHFHMDSTWQTYIAITNPSTATANVWVTAFSDTGTVLSRRNFSLGALNKWGGIVSDPTVLGVTGTGWIYVESDIPIVGLLNFDDYINRMGSMSGVDSAMSIYFPHFHQDANWQTYIALVAFSQGAYVTLTAYADNGAILAIQPAVINPWSKFAGLVGEGWMFPGLTGTGWIEVTSANYPIAGMLNFDDYQSRMGSIEHTIPSTTLYIPHFHMDSSWETFIALANPSSTSTASITINIYNDNGMVLWRNIIGLPARQKIGGLVNSLFPGITGTGWIKAESDIPIVGLVNFDDYYNRMGSVSATQPLSEISYPHFHMDSSWQTFYATVNIGPSATLTVTYYRVDGSVISSVQKTIATDNKRGQFTANGAGWLHIV